MPAKPKSVVFNDLDGVLAEVKMAVGSGKDRGSCGATRLPGRLCARYL